jgi:fumarate reductase subunit D
MTAMRAAGMRRSNEPFFWSLFSAGGTITALLAPVLIVIVGFLVPADQVEYDRLETIFTNPLGRLALVAFAFLTFFHWAHRFRHTLNEIGLKPFGLPIAVACYLIALAGSVWAGMVAFR